mmetsp:Transcript_6046/g.9693  ORF Transcript_6046/g.9693 Transcript_6046/m.9693 type:complete len:85 (+) Transcript_6046:753-1007(+)
MPRAGTKQQSNLLISGLLSVVPEQCLGTNLYFFHCANCCKLYFVNAGGCWHKIVQGPTSPKNAGGVGMYRVVRVTNFPCKQLMF